MNRLGVLHDDNVLALGPLEAQFGYGRCPVLEQACLELRVRPGLCDNLRAVQGADILLVGLDEGIHDVRIDETPLHEQLLESLRAELDRNAIGRDVGAHDASSM